MIGAAEVADAVADYLERLCSREGGNPGGAPAFAGALKLPIVFDPVMVATSGSVLADAATIAAFGRLMRIATLYRYFPSKMHLFTGVMRMQIGRIGAEVSQPADGTDPVEIGRAHV